VSVRTDAHRCFLDTEIGGGNILDPCFEAPMGGEMLLCQESAWANRAVQVTMTNTPDTGSGDADPVSGDPLFLLTVDGRRCGFMGGGTHILANLRANYSCEGGGTAFGSPDRSTTAWTIKFQTARGSDLTDLAIGQAPGGMTGRKDGPWHIERFAVSISSSPSGSTAFRRVHRRPTCSTPF
jgi:hypothetical protein